MKVRYRGFTLIELLIVVVIMAVIISLLLPSLSAAKKRALSRSMSNQKNVSLLEGNPEPSRPMQAPNLSRSLANLQSFSASAQLSPGLSIGTADPESIYTAQFATKFIASNPTQGKECEVQLPLPPQIISLAELEVTVNSQPSETVEVRGDKLVWYGILPRDPTPMSIRYSAVGKGLYHLQTPPGGILDTFHIDLTAVGSDVRMLELSLQPTRYSRVNGQTVYTWDYKRLVFGRPIVVDVLGIAPIDRLGELTWLGPSSVVIFGLVLGLIAHALLIQRFDRWMLLLILGTFTGAYPLMYFAQEFIPLKWAILCSFGIVLIIIAFRATTIMGLRVAIVGVVSPALAILSVTLVAALHIKLQGLLITFTGLALFVLAMVLIPKLNLSKTPLTPTMPLPVGGPGVG